MKRVFSFIRHSLIVLLVFCVVSSAFSAPKISIKVQIAGGGWTVDLDETNLSGGAGSDFVSPIESASDLIDVDVTKPANGWQVSIMRTDSVWNSNIRIYARRTTDGSGTGTIADGTTYQEITTSDWYFFSGTLDRSGLKIQLSLDVDASIGVDNFSTTLYYTATEI
ncbi:MAG: hypothetical protein JW904_13190 [Spirochaetales bacterium]|nr:hypothetical protein [Spirochaetales bacterium]